VSYGLGNFMCSNEGSARCLTAALAIFPTGRDGRIL
jgi:hypothetical protein